MFKKYAMWLRLSIIQCFYKDFYLRHFAEEQLIRESSVVGEFESRDLSFEKLSLHATVKTDEIQLSPDFWIRSDK